MFACLGFFLLLAARCRCRCSRKICSATPTTAADAAPVGFSSRESTGALAGVVRPDRQLLCAVPHDRLRPETSSAPPMGRGLILRPSAWCFYSCRSTPPPTPALAVKTVTWLGVADLFRNGAAWVFRWRRRYRGGRNTTRACSSRGSRRVQSVFSWHVRHSLTQTLMSRCASLCALLAHYRTLHGASTPVPGSCS